MKREHFKKLLDATSTLVKALEKTQKNEEFKGNGTLLFDAIQPIVDAMGELNRQLKAAVQDEKNTTETETAQASRVQGGEKR